MNKLVMTAQAIFNPYRMQIIKLLQEREICVCELAVLLDLSSSRISQHLAVLRRAGIVKERRDGKWIYYSLLPKTIANFNQGWQRLLETATKELPEMKKVLERAEEADLAAVKARCAEKKSIRN